MPKKKLSKKERDLVLEDLEAARVTLINCGDMLRPMKERLAHAFANDDATAMTALMNLMNGIQDDLSAVLEDIIDKRDEL